MIKINLHITNDCNLRCTHCFLNSGRNHMNRLSLDEYDNLISSFQEINVDHVHVTGGEPLMHPHIYEILDIFNKYGIKVEIQSNGVLINEATSEKLKIHGIERVYISLDGKKESHDYRRGIGTYEKAINAINILIANGLKVSVNFCASKENVKDTIDTIELCEKLGVKQFTIIRYNIESRELVTSSTTPLDPIEWLDYVADLENQLCNRTDLNIRISYNKGYFDIETEDVKVRDFNVVGLLFILCDGSIYPCGPSIGNIEPIANFKDNSIQEVLDKISKWKCPKRDECIKCDSFGICTGVCKFQPVNYETYCSKRYKKYGDKEWYPGCPLRGNTLQKDILVSVFPTSCEVPDDYENYYRKLYNK